MLDKSIASRLTDARYLVAYTTAYCTAVNILHSRKPGDWEDRLGRHIERNIRSMMTAIDAGVMIIEKLGIHSVRDGHRDWF